MTPDAPKRIKTTERVFEIIKHIKSEGELTLTELAEEVDLSKSTLHTHLTTLEREEYLVKEDSSYRIGLRFLDLGGHAQQYEEYGRFYNAAKPEIDELAQQTEERAQLMIEEHGYGVYLYQAEGSRAVKSDSHIGTRVPLHSTAVGKAYLAHLPADQAERLLDEISLSANTENTITDREELIERFDEIVDRGVAYDRGERVSGIHCVAAPIETDLGDLIGAVSVSVPANRWTPERSEEKLPEAVKHAARVIGLNTTYS